MPRKRRFFVPNVPVHITQRGHSREPVFYEEQDYATYAHWVRESAKLYCVDVHAFVLMTNHVHLLATPKEQESISLFMQNIGRRYTPYSNRKYGRSGSVWEGRFKASMVQSDLYLLNAMVYIELNPVRAGIVAKPGEYVWSSFLHNVGQRTISFIRAHPVYNSLADQPAGRQREYLNYFQGEYPSEMLNLIRSSTQSGTPIGNDRFKEKIEARLSQKVGYLGRGRPKRVLTP